MKDFCLFLYEESIQTMFCKYSDWVERIIGFIIFLVFLLLFSLIAIVIFWALDYWFTDNYSGVAHMISQDYTPAWTQVVSTGKSTSVIYHPESFDIIYNINNLNVRCSVSEEFYNTFEKGIQGEISYSYGRLSDSIYCNNVIR